MLGLGDRALRRRRVVHIVIFLGQGRRKWGRYLWAATGRKRGSRQPNFRSSIIERIVLIIISAARRLLSRRRWRRSARRIDRSPGIPRRLARGRWRNTPRSSWRDGRRLPSFLRAARGLKGVIIGHSAFVKAGVPLVGPESILVRGARCDVSVVVAVILGDFAFYIFSCLSWSTPATISGGSSTGLAWRRGRRSTTLSRGHGWVGRNWGRLAACSLLSCWGWHWWWCVIGCRATRVDVIRNGRSRRSWSSRCRRSQRQVPSVHRQLIVGFIALVRGSRWWRSWATWSYISINISKCGVRSQDTSRNWRRRTWLLDWHRGRRNRSRLRRWWCRCGTFWGSQSVRT